MDVSGVCLVYGCVNLCTLVESELKFTAATTKHVNCTCDVNVGMYTGCTAGVPMLINSVNSAQYRN